MPLIALYLKLSKIYNKISDKLKSCNCNILFIKLQRNGDKMKVLDKIGLVLFSTLILISSVLLCLMIFGWLDINLITEIVSQALSDQISSNILLGLSIIFILLAIKCIFFDSSTKEKNDIKNSILLENSDGKLLITRDTLENLVDGIVKGFSGAENVTSKVEVDKESNVNVFVNLEVKENVVIKELSSNIQTKIKEAIKKTSDLEVKEVNIKVKDVKPIDNITQG